MNLLSAGLPAEQKQKLRSLVVEHIDTAVNTEWPAMARGKATLAELPKALIECLETTLSITPAGDTQRTAQHEVITALESALEARRQRIVISQSTVTTIK